VTIPPVPIAEQRQSSRGTLGLPKSAILFGFIGQIVPVKGLLTLLDSLAGLATDPRWHLAVAGRDPNDGAPHELLCRERVRQLGLESRVTFLGFLNDPAAFYHAIDAAVVPSLEEPLGRVPLEAGAYATPTIAFATGGLPETMVDGKTGWLVPTGDGAALRHRLAKFLDHPDVEVGLEARTWVESVADPHRYVVRLAELYSSLLR
jgi:glycosyltransferase involved in cell wall biosynthesis